MILRTRRVIYGMRFFNKLKLYFKYLKKEKELREFAIGLDSDVDFKKDLHILFLDYDNVPLDEVEESIKELQDFWNLSDCFLYRTKNGFHAYFYYDIMPYARVRMIIDYAKYVDPMFKFISKYYNYKTIRVAGKYSHKDIVFVKVIKGKRSPTFKEAEFGDLKRREREYLLQIGDCLRKDMLKEETANFEKKQG